MTKETALTIASSDPCGGAGIQADLKTFAWAHVHGASVITCVTAQNTQGVRALHPLPSSIIQTQLDAVLDDLDVAAVKTGLLYNNDIIRLVANIVRKQKLKVVVDPIMMSTTGYPLTASDITASLTQHLIPQSYLVTPNIPEAEHLCKQRIRTLKDMKEACRHIRGMGADNVLLKGGHLQAEYATDILFDGKTFHHYSLPRLKKKAHGSGCTLSALITAYLARGLTLPTALEKAKGILWGMIYYGYQPGKGVDIVNHTPPHYPPPLTRTDMTMWIDLQEAIDQLLTFLPPSMIPEVGINFVYALPGATTTQDVLGITGRIITKNGQPHQAGELQLGASTHIAAITLACLTYNPTVRSAMNIAFSPDRVTMAQKRGLLTGSFNRDDEPRNQRTMDWGTNQVIQTLGAIPDLIWDSGAKGKEPMIRLIASSPRDILEKVMRLTENYKE